MHVSLGELRQTAQKALEAAHVPPGVDHDGAEAAVWLETRGLPGLAGVLGSLAGLTDVLAAGEPIGRLECRNGRHVLVASVRSGLLLAASTVDAAVALAHRNGRAAVHLAGLDGALFLLPEMVRWSAAGWSSALTCGPRAVCASASATGYGLDLARLIEPDAALTLLCEDHAHVAGPGAAEEAAVSSWSELEMAPGWLGARELEQRHRRSVHHGLDVPPSRWDALKTAARGVLVPASARSRGGAGAEVDDNE